MSTNFFIAVLASQLIQSLDICVHECLQSKACTNTTLHCNDCRHICNIRCSGAASCNNLHIIQNPSSATMANLQCEGMHSCKNITLTTAGYVAPNYFQNDVSSKIRSFVCECIPFAIYQLYKNTVMDMFDFVKSENFWLYSLHDLLQDALNTAQIPQLIEYHIDDATQKHSFYVEDETDNLSIDYIIHNMLDYNNNCEQMDHYILSHLDDIPPAMNVVCFLHEVKYELLKIIGSSPANDVFAVKAKVISIPNTTKIDVENNMLVVLKLTEKDSSEEVESQRFSNVVLGDKSVQLIDHSDILHHDHDNAHDRFVIVMEYISDGDLSKYIKSLLHTNAGFTPPAKQEVFANFMVCRVLDDISSSMLHLYRYEDLQTLHNDIKPGNIFIDLRKMRFKLADYGHMLRMPYFLNASNNVDGLGTPNYIPLPMSDLMLHLYDDEVLYHKAKDMYLKYPNHADLYQILASVLSLYNTLCDPQYLYAGDTVSVCRQINDDTLQLDINPEDKYSSFMEYIERHEDENGLLYGVNKARYERLKGIQYEGTMNNKLFHLLIKYINGLTVDYLRYRKNETEHINIEDVDNETYALETFRDDLQTVCGSYMVNDADTEQEFNVYQVWKYENERVVLHKISDVVDDINISNKEDGGENICLDYILFDPRKNNVIYPKKENETNIHNSLKEIALSFNDYYCS